MKLQENISNLKGLLTLKAYDAEGKLLWEDKGHNLIVEEGYKIAAQTLGGYPGAFIARVGVGTNGNLPAPEDRELTEPSLVDINSIEYPKPGVIRFRFRLDYEDAAGKDIREFGLFSEDGRLFSRRTRETIEKTVNMSIVGMWEINFLEE